MKKSLKLSAPRLRVILSASLVLAFLLSIAGFYLAYGQLKNHAKEVSAATAEAAAGQANFLALQTIERKLEEQQNTVERANKIVAESQSYIYQDQIINDLSRFASQAGVTIIGFDFTTAAKSGATGSPAASPLVASSIGGLKSTSVSITLKNPNNYRNLLAFIRYIELNLTRMQLSKLSLIKDISSNGVASDVLSLEVYIR